VNADRNALSFTKKQTISSFMAKADASEEPVGVIEHGEFSLPEMQRPYVLHLTRVRDLLFRGYPSGTILLWETNKAVPLQSRGKAM
jgi:hypothetical protein